jgi:hypothetical protein
VSAIERRLSPRFVGQAPLWCGRVSRKEVDAIRCCASR